MFRRLAALASPFVLAAVLAGCATPPTPPATVTDTIARDPQLSTLSKLIAQAGLADTLRGAGPFTVFAPTDEAFRAVPARTLADLSANPELLRSTLTFHAVPGKVNAAAVETGNVKSVQGANLALSRAGTFVTVEDAVVQRADIDASNGVVHVVDRVLLPPRR